MTHLERSVVNNNWQAHLAAAPPPTRSPKRKAKRSLELQSYYSILETAASSPPKRNKCQNITSKPPLPNNNNNNKNRLTCHVAMDCEMVGVGEDAKDSMLARVSLVNKFGDCIYDAFVAPTLTVTDYRTPVSGIRKEDLVRGRPFREVQEDVARILKGRTLVGHAVHHDLAALFIAHPRHKIRDTSKYQPFRALIRGHTPSLKLLSKTYLNVDIQGGEHSSVEDARATMQLYCLHSRQWEDMISMKRKQNQQRARPPAKEQ